MSYDNASTFFFIQVAKKVKGCVDGLAAFINKQPMNLEHIIGPFDRQQQVATICQRLIAIRREAWPYQLLSVGLLEPLLNLWPSRWSDHGSGVVRKKAKQFITETDAVAPVAIQKPGNISVLIVGKLVVTLPDVVAAVRMFVTE